MYFLHFFFTFPLAGFSSAPEEASGLCGCIVGCRSLRIYNTGVGQQNIQIHTVHLPFAEHWINESGHLSFVVCKKEKKRKRKISFWAFHHSLLNLTLFFFLFPFRVYFCQVGTEASALFTLSAKCWEHSVSDWITWQGIQIFAANQI